MKEEVTERKLKAELDFFKVYAVFIIGLVTGNVNLLNRYFEKGTPLALVLFTAGILILMVVFVMLLRSLFKIDALTK